MRATINGGILFCAHRLYKDVSLCFPSACLFVEIVVRPRYSSGLLLLICRPRPDQINIFVAVRGLSHVLLLLIIVATWEGGDTRPACGLDSNDQIYCQLGYAVFYLPGNGLLLLFEDYVLRTCCRIPALGLD